jgi:FSR family fosmidomycin resistance protein-like MFS transporter
MTMLKDRLQSPETKVALISLAHGVNDTYASYLSTFLPFIRANLGLSYALSGSFNVIVGFFHILCQPIIGYLCDRIRRPVLMMMGPILCGLGAAMLPNTRSYALTIFFAGLWGFGSALYHPQGSGGIGYVCRPENLPRALTWFNIAGTMGTMISPVIAVASVKAWGYDGLLVTLIPALLLAPLLFFSMPVVRDVPRDAGKRAGFFRTIGKLYVVLYPIWAIALLRDLLFQCVRFFLPMKAVAEGGELADSGLIVFFVTLGGTLGMIPATSLAKRFGETRTLLWSMVVGLGIFAAADFAAGTSAVLLYLLGLACVYSTLPLTVTMAQRLLPDERSAASSIVMGLAWGFSNILLFPFGKLADVVGIDMTLVCVGLLPLLGLPFFLAPPFITDLKKH